MTETTAKRIFLVVLVTVILSSVGLVLVFGPQLASQDDSGDTPYRYVFTIEPGSHELASWELAQGAGIYGNFSVSQPPLNEVVMFICNQTSYDVFSSTGEAPMKYNEIYSDFGIIRFIVPETGRWYWVLHNNGTTTLTVDFIFAQDVTAPRIDTNLVLGEQYNGTVGVTITTTDTFDTPKVEFLVDDVLVETQSGKYFSYEWDTTLWSNGSHDISINAQDKVGNGRTIRFPVDILN